MLRTILGYSYLFGYLIYSIPKLLRVRNHDKNSRVEERDKLVHDTVQRWAKTFVKFTKSEIRMNGLENIPKDRAVLFVGNHQSIFDMLILLGYLETPIAFIAKIETSKIPIINYWMKYMNCVFMDRNDIRQSLRAINQGAEYLKSGYSFVIFPEGTRSEKGYLGEFKPGSFKLAIKAGAPIVPFTINDSYKIMSKNKFELNKAEVEIIFSEPIFIENIDSKDTQKLAEDVRNIVRANLIS